MIDSGKQYGLIVHHPKTVKQEAFYAFWSDFRDTVPEVVEEIDEIMQHMPFDYSPVAIFAFDPATLTVEMVSTGPALRKICDDLDEKRTPIEDDDERSDLEEHGTNHGLTARLPSAY